MLLNTDARRYLKATLPEMVTQSLRSCEAYVHRLVACRVIIRQIRGRAAKDRVTLWRSLVRAPFENSAGVGRWREPTLDEDAVVIAEGLGLFHIRRCSDDLAHVVPSSHAKLFETIRRYVREGDTVVDAGANIGAVTVYLARRVADLGRVVAIEMIPDTAACLRKNIELNRLANVVVIERALADRADDISSASFQVGLYGQASISIDPAPARVARRVEVRTTTLDDVLAGIEDVAFVKLDLEGAERLALQGAAQSLERIRCLVFESWTTDGGDAAALLRHAGFSIDPIDGRNFVAQRPAGEDPRRVALGATKRVGDAMKTGSNNETYNDSQVVAIYERASELQPAEAEIFRRWLAPGLSILDVGVGAGRTAPHLARNSRRYVGVDYAQAMVEACCKRFPELEFRFADATDLTQFADGEFDAVVFSFNGIDDIRTDEGRTRCLREIERILAPGGYFIFSSHNAKRLAVWPRLSDAKRLQIPWRILRALCKSAATIVTAATSRHRRFGEGYVHDPVHGGMHHYVSTPAVMSPQIRAAGLEIIDIVAGPDPGVKSLYLTPWHYYACRKARAV